MSAAPTRAIEGVVPQELSAPRFALSRALVDSLWASSEAAACGLDRLAFDRLLMEIGTERKFGQPEGTMSPVDEGQQAAFFATLKLTDIVLARACAAGLERAWERFVELYRGPLLRAGIAIAGNESLGRELADGLYAELYGLTEQAGQRRSPLESYSGRGSLLGWLRATLAQRHVDHYRRSHREEPLEDALPIEAPRVASAENPIPLPVLSKALREAYAAQDDEEKLVLAAYFLDGRTLHQIAALLGVHEATVSRRLKRTTEAIRRRLVTTLRRQGLSHRQAQEALATDPRSLSGWMEGLPSEAGERERQRWKEVLQGSAGETFKEQTGP